MGYIGNQSTKIVYTNLDRFKGALANITALNAITGMSSGDMYKLIDSNHAYMYDGTTWVDMGDIQGPIGPRGVGITSIVRTAGNGSEGTTDTYTITYEDTSTSTFDVKNGTAGTIDHITRTTGTGAAGTTDTYTAYADLAETAPLGSFDVYNGVDGDLTEADLLVHTDDKSNPHSVTKEQVGLSDVDNTSDADKPVSIATAQALNFKLAKTIDNFLEQLTVIAFNYVGSDLTSIVYEGGYKIVYSYTSGNLYQEKFYDTDGTTLLLTKTYSYVDGNLTTITRS